MEDTNKRNGNRNRHRARKPHPNNNYNPPYAADILAKPLADVGLSEQTVAVLAAGKLTTVGDVVRRRKQEMYRVQNFGKRQLLDVSRALERLKVDFRPDETPAPAPQQDKPQQDKRQGREGRDNVPRDKGQPAREAERNQQPKQQNKPQQQQQPQGNKQKNRQGKPQYDDNLTLENLFPKPKMVRLPRIEQQMDEFVKFQRGGKWGFKDKDGHEVIPPIYDEVFNFKEDYACVERKQLFGYIDRQNELVIPYKYVCASSFSEGYACVADEEKCGYINKAGEVVVPFKYEAGTAVKDGLAHVKLDGKWGTLTIATNTISWA